MVNLLPDRKPAQTPLEAMARGAAAGLAATLLLSVLARVLPGIWDEEPRGDVAPKGLPEPTDSRAVEEWQDSSRSPAAHRPPPPPEVGTKSAGPPAATPAGALLRPQAPGPEGLAEQFAFKVAAGVFDRDISGRARQFGLATHLVFGSSWGALYGLVRASCRGRPVAAGPLFGLLVYGIGPAFLVPAMKIMGKPSEEPPERTAMLVAGHLMYGVAVAEAFDALARDDER